MSKITHSRIVSSRHVSFMYVRQMPCHNTPQREDTLFKAAAEIDKTFDKHMRHYVKSLLEYIKLMDKKDVVTPVWSINILS